MRIFHRGFRSFRRNYVRNLIDHLDTRVTRIQYR